MTRFVPPAPQAAELAEYTAKIAQLEEDKRVKEEEAETWESKVSVRQASRGRTDGRRLPETCQSTPVKNLF